MADNTYKLVRFEPRCLSDNTSCVCELVIGLTGEDGEGNSAYIDGIWKPEEGTMLMLDGLTAEKSSEIVNQFAADNNWWSSLDAQIEAQKVQPVNAENFEAPEVTLDTTVEPTPQPEPVVPTPEPEPVEEEEEEEETEETD
tara:strand:- start:1450 stop:1872 length:423 start_codon:yes stop_codon:yes gene_type:complete